MRTSAFGVAATLVLASAFLSESAQAGIVADENGKPGFGSNWTAYPMGNAQFDGIVDVYPARWSIKRGESVDLKVRSTTPYAIRIFRLGWYGGAGAREIEKREGFPAEEQPFPTPDPATGLAEARWKTSTTFTTNDDWVPGLYVARVEQVGGKQAVTFFVVRDDGLPQKQPILFVIGTATHAAYNAWPGAERGGKSLYGFNSSKAPVNEGIFRAEEAPQGVQAVKVSTDRPYLVGGGIADVGGYEYPFLRFLERNGWEVAYALDEDLHRDPEIARGRKVVTFSGHEEYTSWEMFDHAIAARDSGTSFLFLSGDTWSWQVRFEPGPNGPYDTVVGYKESFVRDPEHRVAIQARDGRGAFTTPDLEEAKRRAQRVTRGWKGLTLNPTPARDAAGKQLPGDLARPGMLLTGVQSAAQIRAADGTGLHGGNYPWADLVIANASSWVYQGTGAKTGDVIPNVFGYEIDSMFADQPHFAKFRPEGMVRIGSIRQVSDGRVRGSAGFYRHGSGAEVLSLSAIYTAWGLDDWAARLGSLSAGETSVDPRLQQMVTNALVRWTGDQPPPPPDPPTDPDTPDEGDPDDVEQGVIDDPAGGGPNDPANPANPGDPTSPTEAAGSSGGCAFGGGAAGHASYALGLAALAALIGRRRRVVRR
jgi:MYXO-CTERM domain-containing protein